MILTPIGFLIVCILVGGGIYLFGMAPIDPTVQRIIRVVLILILVIYAIIFIAHLLGLSTGLPPMRVR